LEGEDDERGGTGTLLSSDDGIRIRL
jgi:hypothetical protein